MYKDFITILQDVLTEFIPSQKCHTDTCPVILTLTKPWILEIRWFEPYTEHQSHIKVLQHRQFNYVVPDSSTLRSNAMFSSDLTYMEIKGEWGPVTEAANSACHLAQSIGRGVHPHTPSTVHWNTRHPVWGRVFRVVQINLNFHPQLSNRWESNTCSYSYDISERTMQQEKRFRSADIKLPGKNMA